MKPPIALRAETGRGAPRSFALALLLASLPYSAAAQTQIPTPSQAAAAPGQPGGGQAVQMNPFEVKADSDTSYGALNSRSITAFNTALSKLPVSADIFDQAFMNDVGATTVENMIQTYSAGTGQSGLNAGASAFENQPGDRVTQTYIQMRGMPTPNIQRDSLLYLGWPGAPGGTSIGQSSNFDTERVEIINGPNALLYDGGGAGGVINVVSKEARIGEPAFGSITFRTDEWGSKYGLLDYGMSEGNLAVRLAVIDTTDDTRRTNIGDHLTGSYVQFADQAGKTLIRLSMEETTDLRTDPMYMPVNTSGDKTTPIPLPTGGTTTASIVNSQSMGYLLATGQAAGLDNGQINWSNVNSFAGSVYSETTTASYAMIEADTKWTDWLSTQFSAGTSEFMDDHYMDVQGMYLYSPYASANPIQGSWTVGMTNTYAAQDAVRPAHGQGLRFSVLLTNDLFNGRAKSQTDIGSDLVDSRTALIDYAYYKADSNWNIITNGSSNPSSSAGSRTLLPEQAWSVNDGPLDYPLFRLGSPRITYQGVNYVRAMENPFVPALVSPSNPNGTALDTGVNGLHGGNVNDGVYATNYSQWLDGKWDTLLGARLEHAYEYAAEPTVSAETAYVPMEIVDSHSLNFSAGVDYHVLPWLTPYVGISDSYLVPPSLTLDPNGDPLPVCQALGEEAGLKVANATGTISGSLSLYHTEAKNQEFLMSSTLALDINPSGLNGSFGGDGYAANAESEGVQLALTASPTNNWRMRLSAAIANGTIQSTRTYNLHYNDQFHENSQGQVTFANGQVVYVTPKTFLLSTPAYDAANAPATAVPLTVTLLSTPGNLYYAAPLAASGQISPSSDAAKVLEYTSPTDGPILTGATGLPISAYQLNPALTGVPVPGAVPVAIAGDDTTGYPEFSANFTSIYTVSSGGLKGFRFGGTVSDTWKNRSYYYYPTSLVTGGPTAERELFMLPTLARLDLIFGYTRKLRHVTFSTQVNINNIFNHYSVIVYPSYINGWTAPASLNANFDQQPRAYSWTNRIDF